MPEKITQVRVLFTFAMMLVFAMSLQSIVVIILGVKNSVRDDIDWAHIFLEKVVITTSSEDGFENINSKKLPEPAHEIFSSFSCVLFESETQEISQQGKCRFLYEMRVLSGKAKEKKADVIRYVGNGRFSFMSMSEAFLIAVPLIDINGKILGVIAAERSLRTIYSRSWQELKIILSYLLVNTIIISILFFFRVQKLFFRPLDKLVEIAESYHHDTPNFALFSDDKSPFRKLTDRLNALVARIDSDNKILRKNIHDLELANTELNIKNDLVIRSEKLASAGRLSAGLAHEIGNPLSIIQGYIELLGRDDLTDAEKRDFSERAQQELDRIKRLIRQLIDFAGPSNENVESVCVDELIRDVIRFVAIEKMFGECNVRTELLTENVAIVANKDAIRQVLLNCLLNAVDATFGMVEHQREIVILTYLEESTEGKEKKITISIQDNGQGIAEEQLAFVFDPFYTTKEVGRGTGLGLFVCHMIVEKMGGTITLYNRIPHGVEVRIVLQLQ